MRWWCCIALSWSLALPAQRSPFNDAPLLQPDSNGSYRLVIGGHFHGASHNASGFPAATLLANLDTINALGAHALLSTGDLFLDADADRERYERALFSRLRPPLFNAPGNHDVEGRTYVERYGPTHAVFDMGPDRIIILDTERHDGAIRDEQLTAVAAQAGAGLRNLFIVSHRPVWAEDDPVYSQLFAGNTRSMLGTNFRSEVFPLLERIATGTQVYWISGSMAGRAPYSIFFQPHAPGITYIQSAIRDVPRDALLVADVGAEGVEWWGLSLTGRNVPPVRDLTASRWASDAPRAKEPFNWRLLPYIAARTVSHRAFWWGGGVMLLLVLIVRRLTRRRA